MLMVIFGAGASYDSDPSHPPSALPSVLRPPLANQLFDNRPLFSEALQKFPQCQPIIPYLRTRKDNASVEQVLEGLQAEAQEYPPLYRQLAAIRLYLHFVLWECEIGWNSVTKGITNYKTLLDRIERWRSIYHQVCLVTFNYDTMLETALPVIGIKVKTMADYISNKDYKLIKAHGSVNWAREVRTPIENLAHRNAWEEASELIDRADALEISDTYRIVASHPIGLTAEPRVPILPAVAIPVETKRAFECPPDHLEALRMCIPQVKKLLIIGWRGTEQHFAELLKGIPPGIAGMIVTGDQGSAKEVANRLSRYIVNVTWSLVPGGFTDFVTRREADKFLRG